MHLQSESGAEGVQRVFQQQLLPRGIRRVAGHLDIVMADLLMAYIVMPM